MKQHRNLKSNLLSPFLLLLSLGLFTAATAQTPSRDSLVRPGDDFYQYVNGRWLDTAAIPDDLPACGGFATLAVENQARLRAILEDLAAHANLPPGSIEQKVGDLYGSGMDTSTINRLGGQPLRPVIRRIDAVSNYQELLVLLAQLYREGNGQLLGFSVGPDFKNSSINIVNFSQAGTTLPEKSYYTNADNTSVLVRQRLELLISNLLTLSGEDSTNAKAGAKKVLELEAKLSASHLSNVALRDLALNYHKMSLPDLGRMTPHLDWPELFSIMGVKTDSLNVGQPAYLKALDSLLPVIPIETWKDKIKYVYIYSKAAVLSRPFQDAAFRFEQVFNGQSVQPERWKTMVALSDGELLGQLYVKRYFTPAAKGKMDSLVDNLLAAFRFRLSQLDWMSDSTRKEALLKLSRIRKKIGYPDKIRSYDDVPISRDDLFGNNERYSIHAYRESIAKINQPVDRALWEMTAPTVNAYYNPANNEIVFPAGILQPPFFDVHADDATNYGAIGMVISHEITHGFDDQGRKFDASGNLRDWWTAEDAAKFAGRTKVLIDQYSRYKVLGQFPVNGQLTLGENIADQGGIAIAYDAFQMTAQGRAIKSKDSLAAEQRFFSSFARIWRSKSRDNYARLLITIDTHSPDKFRVNGTLSNFTPFYDAYSLTEKDAMFRKQQDRVKIW